MKAPAAVLATLLAATAWAGGDSSKLDPPQGGFEAGGTVNLGSFACFGTNGGCIGQVAADTPDASMLLTGSTSNAWIIAEYADRAFDFGHAAQTHPTLFIQSANQVTNEWLSLSVSGGASTSTIQTTSAKLYINPAAQIVANPIGSAGTPVYAFNTGAGNDGFYMLGTPSFSLGASTGAGARYLMVGTAKALTEAVATPVVQIGIPSGGSVCGGRFEYTVEAGDGTDFQARHGRISFQAVNKAGVETATPASTAETADGSTIAASLGTLTYTVATDTTPTNAFNFTINATSSLVQTTLLVSYRVELDTPLGSVCTITPQ